LAYLRSFWARLRVGLFSLLGATSTSAATLPDGDSGEVTWQRAMAADTTAAYEIYLRDYPVGGHVRQALERIVELSAIAPRSGADHPIQLAAEDRSWGKDAGDDRDRGIGQY